MTRDLTLSPCSPDAPRAGASSTSRQPLPAAWVERIFARLSAYYGSRFADAWRGCDLGEVRAAWSIALADYSGEEIARGLDACRLRDWPPTLPEFARLCRPPIDHEGAYHEAVEQMHRRKAGSDRWSNPAIYWAAVDIGGDLMSRSYPEIRSRWQAALDRAVEGVRSGELPAAIPPRHDALPAPGRQTTPQVAAQHLTEIKAMLSRRPASTRTCPQDAPESPTLSSGGAVATIAYASTQ